MKLQRHLFHLMGMVLIVAFLAAGAWIIVRAVQPASPLNPSEQTVSPSAPPSVIPPDASVSPLSPQSTLLQNTPSSSSPTDTPAPSPTPTNPMEGGVLNWLKELFTRLN